MVGCIAAANKEITNVYIWTYRSLDYIGSLYQMSTPTHNTQKKRTPAQTPAQHPATTTITIMTTQPTPVKKIDPISFILNAHFTIKKHDAPAFLAATKLVYDACLREPECLFYHVGRLDSIQPTWLTELPEEESEECVITFSEGWNCTLEWYKEVQFRKEYYGPHMKVAGAMWTKPRKLDTFVSCACFVVGAGDTNLG